MKGRNNTGLVAALVVAMLATTALGETYVADVDAVETDKTQYFDTGIAVDGDIKVEMDLMWMSIDNDDNMLFGASDGSQRCFLSVYNGHYYIGYGTKNISIQGGTICPAVGVRHTVTCVLEDEYQSFSTNGVVLGTASQGVTRVNDTTLVLLGYHKPAGITYKCSVRLYSAKIWKKEAGEWSLVRDYKPILAKQSDGTTCVGALSDETQGQVASAGAAARAVIESVVGEPDEMLSWVETDGRQFVDTEVTGGSAFSFSADFAWKNLGTGSNEEFSLLGATSGYGYFRVIHAISKAAGGQMWIGYGAKQTYPVNSENGYFVMKTFARKTVSGEFAANSQTISCDGVAYSLVSPNASVVTSHFAPLYIFASDLDSSTEGSRVKQFASVRFHSLSISLGGTEVRHFLPCLKDGAAALYDSVNHRIYRSPIPFSAYGKLSDVPESYVEYIETSGAQYVDTGLIGKTGTKCEFDFAWLNHRNLSTLLGVRNDTSGSAIYFEPFYGDYGYGSMKSAACVFGSTWHYLKYTSSDIGELNKVAHLKVGERHHLNVELDAGSLHATVDGNCYFFTNNTDSVLLPGTGVRSVVSGAAVADSIDAEASMYLFARHIVTATDDMASDATMASVRLYKAKIWQKDGSGNYQLVRDYRPVKLSTGEIVLWDKVNKNHLSACWSGYGAETSPYYSGFILIVE